ncbi:restriction endonuclease subunit S [Endozoicomonas acroporae]|uniref:restriction endonuclease subunit S n=1 Tax=Endozoicomonas acroporae TaxID=1701104 RepID=UPI0013D38E58|nr:restriction endonuclease subunit S [Endozoicomonas acroporae]
MESVVTKDFKNSPIGMIPHDWDIRQLQDIAESISVGIATSTTSSYVEKGVPFIRNQNILPDKLKDNDLLYISDSFDQANKNKRLQSGDVLTVRTGYPGISCVVPEKYVGAQTFTTLITRPLKKYIEPTFLSRYFNSPFGSEQMLGRAAGGAQQNINAGSLKSLHIPIPPLPEQKKIARILSSVDSKLALIDQQITTTQTLKKGLMQKLFTQGVGTQDADGRWQPHTEFQETELGKIPVAWLASLINQHVSKVGSGVTPKGGSKAYLSEGIPLIRSQNVLVGRLDLTDVAYISNEQYQKMKSSMLESNDVLLNITGASIGRCCLLPKNIQEANVNQHVCIIRTTDDLLPSYTAYFFNSEFGQSQIWSLQAGGNREGLNFQQIRSFRIPLPPLKEQQEIARILSTVDRKLDHLQTQKAQTQQLKKGLMQKLLTGQIRVQPDPQDN